MTCADVVRDETILPNMRGRVTNSVDLQEAIRQNNLLHLFPIQVIPHPTEAGKVLVWDGFRRMTAVEALGMSEVPVVISQGTPEQALEWQIATNLRKDFPVISLNSDGAVVGGLCWAVYNLAQKRHLSNRQIKAMTGLPVDTVSALRHLYDEDTAVKRRVLSGELDITVYARLKKQPQAVKDRILSRPGKITRERMDRDLRDYKSESPSAHDEESDGRIEMSGTAVTARLLTITTELEWLLGQELDDTAVTTVARIARLAQNKLMET